MIFNECVAPLGKLHGRFPGFIFSFRLKFIRQQLYNPILFHMNWGTWITFSGRGSQREITSSSRNFSSPGIDVRTFDSLKPLLIVLSMKRGHLSFVCPARAPAPHHPHSRSPACPYSSLFPAISLSLLLLIPSCASSCMQRISTSEPFDLLSTLPLYLSLPPFLLLAI